MSANNEVQTSVHTWLRRAFTPVVIALVVVAASLLIPQGSVQAAGCSTSNVRAYDMGGGKLLDPNYVIDVYDVNRTDGHFIYYNVLKNRWEAVRFRPWTPINNGAGIRWGISTWWTVAHPYWPETAWRYIYPC